MALELQAIPHRGGMNMDDSLDNLPPNDYEYGENLISSVGDRALEKLYGTTSMGDIVGNCFGLFKFNNYALAFIHDGDFHKVYRINLDDTIDLVFSHLFNIDPTIKIVSCIVIHEKIVAFNNAVDEPMKFHLDMAELTIGFNYITNSFNFTGFQNITPTEIDGQLAFTSATNFPSEMTRMFVFVGGSVSNRAFYTLSNTTFSGFLKDSKTFITDKKFQSLGVSGVFYGRENLFEVESGYNKVSTNDYYFINKPFLAEPTISLTTDPEFQSNFIKRNYFQFAVKYIYHDNSQSAISKLSDTNYNINVLRIDNTQNVIEVSVNHPALQDIYTVKEIVFLCKKNDGNLYEFNRINVEGVNESLGLTDKNAPIVTKFYNNEVPIFVSEKEAVNLFDRVPRRANDLFLLNNSIVGFTGIKNKTIAPYTQVDIEEIEKRIDFKGSEDYVIGFCYGLEDRSTIFYGQVKSYTFVSGLGIANLEPVSVPVYASLHSSLFFTNKTSPTTADKKEITITNSKTFRNTYTRGLSDSKPGVINFFETAKAFFEFSDTQTIGTKYEIKIMAMTNPPSGKQFKAINYKFTVTADTTSTDDLITKIKSNINGSPFLNFSFGQSGSNIVTTAKDYTEYVDGFTAPSGKKTIQISSGYVSPDTRSVDWYQVDLEVQIKKISGSFEIYKTQKSNSETTVALQYYDANGRVISNQRVGVINNSSYKVGNNYFFQKGIRFKIVNDAPEHAHRYSFLLSENNSYSNVQYFRVTISAVADGRIKITYGVTSYNEEYGASLAYTLTKGDIVRRVLSYNDVSEEYEEVSSENSGISEVLKQDGIILELNHDGSNPYSVGDIIEIVTPKKDFKDNDKLLYEIQPTFEIENRKHKGNIRSKGEDLKYAADFEKSKLYDNGSASYGDNKVFIYLYNEFDLKVLYDQYPPVGGKTFYEAYGNIYVTIHNSILKGTYPILFMGFNGDAGDNGVVIDLDYNATDISSISETIYMSWTNSDDIYTTSSVKEYITITELFDIGNAYARYRGSNYDTFVESFSMSDLFDSKNWGKGRPSLVEEFYNLNQTSAIYYSEPFYNNTTINGISTIYGSNFEEYNENYGEIKRAIEKDGRVILFHENKVGWIQVNKGVISTASGGEIISRESSVISSEEGFFDYEGGIGNQIYSICMYGDYIYFANNIVRKYFRLASNGIFPISDYKMHSYFQELFEDSDVVIQSIFNNNNNEIILNIKSSSINKQLTFKEGRNRWVSFWSINSGSMLFFNKLISFSSNKFWKHTSSSRNEIYGSQVDSRIIKTFNGSDYNQSKSFKSWLSINLDPLFIDSDVNKIIITNDEGQESELIMSDFERDGAGFWSEFLRDKNTPNLGSLNPLFEGDDLQSKTITINMKNNSQTNDKIEIVSLRYIDLDNNPK